MMPNKVGIYEIKSELGRGGMSTVFRAYDPRFERDVAIKVLPPELIHADPQFRLRFEREAKVIAQLEHSAIVPVYDVGEADGQPYFVMRYMSGGSLSDRIRAGLFTVEEATRILAVIAPAMDEAHSKGIVHRDIKPSNILFDQRGNPFISDFGIAKLSQAQSGSVTGSAIIGTPAYMAPEQAQGAEVDGRADIYALGIVLFEMLTGKQPYEADSPMAVAIKHITDPVPYILNVQPNLLPGIDAIIQKAMAKNRDGRFASTKEMIDALRILTGGLPGPIETMERPIGVQSNVSSHAVPNPNPAATRSGSVIWIAIPVFTALLLLLGWLGLRNIDLSATLPFLRVVGVGIAVFVVGFVAVTYVPRLISSYRARVVEDKSSLPKQAGELRQQSASMTFNVLADIDPHKRKEILTLIGRDHELRLKDRIIHFGGGRYLLHGYGRFGATALIDQIVKMARYELASQGPAGESGVVMTVRIDASTFHETDNGFDAVIEEFRFESQRDDSSKALTTQLNRLQKQKIAEIEKSSREHTMAIKLAPIPGISAEFARKTGQNLAQGKKSSDQTDLMDLIVKFLDRAENQKPIMFESFAYRFMSNKKSPTRLIIVIDKFQSETVFDIMQQMHLFKDKRISFFAILSEEQYLGWSDNPRIRKIMGDLGFESHYVPCLWEDETSFVEKLMGEAFTIKNNSDRARDFKDHVAFVARGSPGDAIREALRHEYCELKLGIPILNLSNVREWDRLQVNARIQRILCSNWERILSSWFNGSSSFEKDRAKRAIYGVMDWMNSRVVFTMPQIQEYSSQAPVRLSDTEQIQNNVLRSLVSILIEEKYLISNGENFGLAHRVKPENLQQ